MRKSLTIVAALCVLSLLAGGAAAGPLPTLTAAPTGFTCGFSLSSDGIECSWELLSGASKYSVDVVANYELGVTELGVAGGSVSAEFDFGTSLTSITIPLSSFPADINADGAADALTSLVLRVKGLAPPGKNATNQNNPFSSPTVTCTVSTATCN